VHISIAAGAERSVVLGEQGRAQSVLGELIRLFYEGRLFSHQNAATDPREGPPVVREREGGCRLEH